MLGSVTDRGGAKPHRYLITGGAGFIGSHLVDLLLERGDEVVVLDDFSTGNRRNVAHHAGSPSFELVEGSTLDEPTVDQLMASADSCLHLASAVGVQLVVSRPLDCLMRNVRGTDVVFTAAARHGVRLLYTSTSEVYGKNSHGALAEDSDRILGSPFKSRWAYAIAKSFGESMAHGMHRDTGAEVATVRLFNCVGPRQTGQYGMVLPRFVGQAVGARAITVYGTGEQTRCFAHVEDVVQAILLVHESEAALGKVFNVGAETPISITELARRVVARTGGRGEVTFVPYEDAYDDGFEELGRRQPDTTLLRELTGWRPERTIDDAIDDVVAYEQGRWTPRRRAELAT